MPDGRTAPVRRIGRGTFSVAYATAGRHPRVYVDVRDDYCDRGKTIAAAVKSPHVPPIRVVGPSERGIVYAMPLYCCPLRKADGARAWNQYKVLRQCLTVDGVAAVKALPTAKERNDGGQVEMAATIRCVERSKAVPASLVKALKDLRRVAAIHGPDYTFEFSPRNLAVGSEGQLVLLDAIYSPRVWVECKTRGTSRRSQRNPVCGSRGRKGCR